MDRPGAAYANLPDSLKVFLDGLRAEHRFGGRAPRWASGSRSEQHVVTEPYVTEHPIVRVHPETGERALFVTPPGFTSRIVGVSPRQSDRLLDLLFEEITNPAYTVRVRWEDDSIGVWDNRITAHQAPPTSITSTWCAFCTAPPWRVTFRWDRTGSGPSP